MEQIKWILFFISLLSFGNTFSQPSNPTTDFYTEINQKTKIDSTCKILLTSVIITGNKKTKDYVILREMNIKTGDSITASKLYDKLKESRNLIYNTNLFSIVEVVPYLSNAFEFTISIHVIEKWYIYPTPQFKLVDRNFNDWLKTYHADFKRVNYGMRFSHYNVSGRGDQLNIELINGYTRNYSASYIAPYSNAKLTEGFSVGMGYSQNKELSYQTSYNNKLLLFKTDQFNRTNFYFNASYRKRKGFYNRHFFAMQFNYLQVNDSITSFYNPNYFNSNKSKMPILDLSYGFQYINVNNINYPLNGKIYTFSLTKRGLGIKGGINMLTLDASYRKYFRHPRHFYSSIAIFSKITLPFEQAYINQRALGFGDFYLNGFEYYVIDGVASALAKYNLSKKIVSFKIPVPFKIKQLPYIPFSFYAKTFANFGFAYNKKKCETNLNNRLLYSGGFGIDIISLYDLKLSLEFSYNQLGEKGLFLHARNIL